MSKEDQQHIFEIMLKLMKKKEYGAALFWGIFMIRDDRLRLTYYAHLYMQTFHCACYIYTTAIDYKESFHSLESYCTFIKNRK